MARPKKTNKDKKPEDEAMKLAEAGESGEQDTLDELFVTESPTTHQLTIEQIVEDSRYECLLMRTENGQPFFNPEMRKHLRKFAQIGVDYLNASGDDPVLQTPWVHDVEVQKVARAILDGTRQYIESFEEATAANESYAKHPLTRVLAKVIFSLMMAANENNLIENLRAKSCHLYFVDFQRFLREALNSNEYLTTGSDWLAIEEGGDPWLMKIVRLLHLFCYSLFAQIVDRREMTFFISQLVSRGNLTQDSKVYPLKSQTVWHDLSEKDEQLRTLFSHYLNGPVMRAIDLIYDGRSYAQGFDPIANENYPEQLFAIHHEKRKINVLRLPSPTVQFSINEAKIADEFRGLIDFFATPLENQKLLIFNLQDRNAWSEHKRSATLEEFQNKRGYKNHLVVVSLPKCNDFYNQTDAYAAQNSTKLFMDALVSQVKAGGDCGFYFPDSLSESEIIAFTQSILPLIHSQFFQGASQLTVEARCDFIEIFYQFLAFKIMAMSGATAVSFTCKDGIDVGAAASSAFFGFLKELSGYVDWSEEEREFLLWMLYAPAIRLRDRPIRKNAFTRLTTAMDRVHEGLVADRGIFDKSMKELFTAYTLSHLHVTTAA